jgi:hypothetical protein
VPDLSFYRKPHFTNRPLCSLLLVFHHLLKLAVVLGNGNNLSLCRRVSGDSGGSDAPARASRGVSLGTVARGGIGWDSCGTDGGGGIVDVVLGLGSDVGVDSDGDGGGSSCLVSNSIPTLYSTFVI